MVRTPGREAHCCWRKTRLSGNNGTPTMFCPSCKTEYRPGFTKCADCDIALVDHLPAGGPPGVQDAATDSEGRELLWSGLSSKLYEAIRDALDAAGISHTDVEKEFGSLPTFAQSAQLIWIDPRLRDAARSVLHKVLADRDPEDMSHRDANSDHLAWMDPFNVRREVYASQSEPPEPAEGGELPESGADTEPPPDDSPEDFRPEDATSQVWAGEDMDIAQFLKDSLSGIGIGCVVSKDGGKGRVLVLPADEKRAREIVREVVEGAPPE